MTDYQTHNEIRRLQRGRLVTLVIAFVTAFAFVWGNDVAITIAMCAQITLWGTWSFIIQGDIALLKKRLAYEYEPPRNPIRPIESTPIRRGDGVIAEGSKRNVIPIRDKP